MKNKKLEVCQDLRVKPILQPRCLHSKTPSLFDPLAPFIPMESKWTDGILSKSWEEEIMNFVIRTDRISRFHLCANCNHTRWWSQPWLHRNHPGDLLETMPMPRLQHR